MSDPNLATAVAPTAATTAVVSSVAATTAVATVSAVVTPKRGGLHPTYGKFIGGAKLTDQYMLVPLTSGSYFRFFTQPMLEARSAGFRTSVCAYGLFQHYQVEILSCLV